MKYLVLIETDKPLKWVKELVGNAVQMANDPSYRGFGFKKPIKKFRVKKKKKHD